jgi:hypothetical protein
MLMSNPAKLRKLREEWSTVYYPTLRMLSSS